LAIGLEILIFWQPKRYYQYVGSDVYSKNHMQSQIIWRVLMLLTAKL
jgi:hypothetical protein